MDGRTNAMFIGRSLLTGRTRCCKVSPSEKKKKKKKKKKKNIQCQTYAKTEGNIELKFSASPAQILGTTENATFAHLMKKFMHLKTGFLSDYQGLFLLLNGSQIETCL